ncbi:MAG: IS110 family RNA-guided transposase [Planctomycetota bacterium]|jgi:transposase
MYKESTRIEEFRQVKKEIRGSEEYLIVGIDVAKDKHHAFFGTATGKTLLKKLVFDNSIGGFEKLLSRVDALKSQHCLAKVVFGFEPTGNYHKPLGAYLTKYGFMVVLVSGVAVKRNRELLDGRWDKHDTKDSANVADLISQGKCLFYESPSAEITKLRDLLSVRKRLKKEEHSVRMRIRNSLLAKHFPELDRLYGQCESESLAIVRWCLDPRTIASMDFDRFFQIATCRERGIAQRRRLAAIWNMAHDSVGCLTGEASEFEAKVLVEKLKQVRQYILETDKLTETVSRRFIEYSYLLTIPGFGPYVSSRVIAAISNPYRFENNKQVLKMAGYDLSAARSGKRSDKAVPVISKRGNSDLRYALYQAAFVASTRNSDFIVYYTNMLRGREREKGIRTKMRVKLAAKLLVIAWTLMKKKESFNPKYLNVE